ncbi:MAG: phosphotransferase [Streptosporangiaceae bacterium]
MGAPVLAQWCARHLGSLPASELFRSGHLSAVIGLRLADDREVVVKVRPRSPRIAACVEVQRRLFQSGYPCPEPLTGAAPFGGDVATAEAYVGDGAMLPGAGRSSWAFAEAFAQLVLLAPRPAEVPALVPSPSWAYWSHAEPGLWPRPEGRDVDLNAVAGPAWIDDAGRRARDRLRAGPSGTVIGHCDWLADNLRWTGDTLLVVHDWDSGHRRQRGRPGRPGCGAVLDRQGRRPCHCRGNSPVPRRVRRSTRPGTHRGRNRTFVGGWLLDPGLRHPVSARRRAAHLLTHRGSGSRAPAPGRSRLTGATTIRVTTARAATGTARSAARCVHPSLLE